MAFINPKTGFVYESPEERAPRITERQQNWTGLGLQRRGQDIASRGQDLRDRQAMAALAQQGHGMQMAHQLGLGRLADAAEGRRLQGRRLGLYETGANRAHELDLKGLTLAERQQAAAERAARRAHRLSKGDQDLAKDSLEQLLTIEKMRDETAREQIDAASTAQTLLTVFGSGLTANERAQTALQAEEWARVKNQEAALQTAELNRLLTEEADGWIWNADLSDNDVVTEYLRKIGKTPEEIAEYAILTEDREGKLTNPYSSRTFTGKEWMDKNNLTSDLEKNVQALRDLIGMLQGGGSRGLGYPGQTQRVPDGGFRSLVDAYRSLSGDIPGGAQ